MPDQTQGAGGVIYKPQGGGVDWLGTLVGAGIPTAATLGRDYLQSQWSPSRAETAQQIAEKKREFDVQQAQRGQEQSRRAQLYGLALPMHLTALGMAPQQAQQVAQQYTQSFKQPAPALGSAGGQVADKMAMSAAQQQAPGGPGAGRMIANAGLGMAPVVAGGLIHGGAAAGGTAAGGAGGLGATMGALASNPITWAVAGGIGAG